MARQQSFVIKHALYILCGNQDHTSITNRPDNEKLTQNAKKETKINNNKKKRNDGNGNYF